MCPSRYPFQSSSVSCSICLFFILSPCPLVKFTLRKFGAVTSYEIRLGYVATVHLRFIAHTGRLSTFWSLTFIFGCYAQASVRLTWSSVQDLLYLHEPAGRYHPSIPFIHRSLLCKFRSEFLNTPWSDIDRGSLLKIWLLCNQFTTHYQYQRHFEAVFLSLEFCITFGWEMHRGFEAVSNNWQVYFLENRYVNCRSTSSWPRLVLFAVLLPLSANYVGL